MPDNPMGDWRFRVRLALEVVRDRAGLHVPPGHYYSPIPSWQDIARASSAWSDPPDVLPGIDLRLDAQVHLLDSWLPAYGQLPDWSGGDGYRFTYDNTWFTYADAVTYALMLRHAQPARVIEVGSGFSSALALDVDEIFLGSRTAFTFIDPYPERLVKAVAPAELEGRLVASPVQDVPVEVFDQLTDGDVLFIDSSHVLKAGSDVQFLFDQVLPRLAPGVLVHFHDVFYPFEYPDAWLRARTALNEAYALRIMLQSTSRWRIELFHPALTRLRRDWVGQHMPLLLAGDLMTGGIWLRRL